MNALPLLHAERREFVLSAAPSPAEWFVVRRRRASPGAIRRAALAGRPGWWPQYRKFWWLEVRPPVRLTRRAQRRIEIRAFPLLEWGWVGEDGVAGELADKRPGAPEAAQLARALAHLPDETIVVLTPVRPIEWPPLEDEWNSSGWS